MSWTTYIVFDAFCIFYRNCKKIWRRLRWIIKNSCKNTSEYMRISLPSHPCSHSVFPEIGRKIRGCIRVCLAFSFYGLSRAQPEMARASKADWVEHMDSRACWYTSCKDDVKQHVECSWLLFLKFVVFSLWHAPCWFFLFLVSWRSNTAIFRAKRGSARQAHKNERGAGQMKWEYFLFPNLDS